MASIGLLVDTFSQLRARVIRAMGGCPWLRLAHSPVSRLGF